MADLWTDASALARIRSSLLAWYAADHRDFPWRRTTDPYVVLVSEVMLQQTQASRVAERFPAFMDRFPTARALAVASEAEVLAAWSGLGYNRRALALRRAAAVVSTRGWPREVVALERLPGIGPYTARAVASLAFGEPVGVVDTNVRRWLVRRLGLSRHAPARDLQTTADALAALRSSGVRVIMASGDAVTTASAVAAALGIDEVHGEVKPADKLALVAKLQQAGRIVAMAGDGINDAPALAKADVGVAMGTGTDVAMTSAPVTLVKGDLRGIAQARAISQETVRNMKQNLGFAFIYNSLGIPVAAGALYPLTGWLLSPMIAALAMSLSSVSVITNALRLRRSRTSP